MQPELVKLLKLFQRIEEKPTDLRRVKRFLNIAHKQGKALRIAKANRGEAVVAAKPIYRRHLKRAARAALA